MDSNKLFYRGSSVLSTFVNMIHEYAWTLFQSESTAGPKNEWNKSIPLYSGDTIIEQPVKLSTFAGR
jgi:hypothetical protein